MMATIIQIVKTTTTKKIDINFLLLQIHFKIFFFHSENKEKRSNKKKEGKKVNMLLKIKSSSYKGNSK